MEDHTETSLDFALAARDLSNQAYLLQLYIAGPSPRSKRAVETIKQLCSETLSKDCELQVIDIFQQPHLAKIAQVFAVPTLIKRLPNPKRLFVGDMSDTESILASLEA